MHWVLGTHRKCSVDVCFFLPLSSPKSLLTLPPSFQAITEPWTSSTWCLPKPSRCGALCLQMTSRMTLIGIQLCRACFSRHQTDPSVTFLCSEGKGLRVSSWENKVSNHFTNVIEIFFEDNQKDFSWITYCFYLTQTSTTCLSPCQLPYVAPNCCVIWTAFAYLCQFDVDHKCQTDFSDRAYFAASSL